MFVFENGPFLRQWGCKVARLPHGLLGHWARLPAT